MGSSRGLTAILPSLANLVVSLVELIYTAVWIYKSKPWSQTAVYTIPYPVSAHLYYDFSNLNQNSLVSHPISQNLLPERKSGDLIALTEVDSIPFT